MIAKRSAARIGMRCEKGLVYLSKYLYINIENKYVYKSITYKIINHVFCMIK